MLLRVETFYQKHLVCIVRLKRNCVLSGDMELINITQAYMNMEFKLFLLPS